MRSPLFSTLARWSLALAFSAGVGCFADSIITTPSVAQSSISLLELEESLFGYDPADGYSVAQQSQLWTTNANAALYTNLLALITTLGGDQSMIAELFQPGAVFAGQTNPYAVAVQSFSTQTATPEPATIGLFGGGLLFLCCYAFWRKRSYGPIQRTDKP
jgi:hypothetical protein